MFYASIVTFWLHRETFADVPSGGHIAAI